ncbi:MAG: carboxypeptidase-like regulatory domain-containing protein [Gemmatimonadaceae bacterium]|nr:carboxypeptidase-like regulatory domain-containing protein [Gemmatimonadaceae bacterium]
MAHDRFHGMIAWGVHFFGRWVRPTALTLAGMPAILSAQSLQGSLLRADSMPAAGVIVVASRGAQDSVLARTITNGNGRYAIDVSAGAVRLRALRIGHRPVLIGEFTLAAGARRDIRTVLPNDPIVLATVTTEASSSCRQTGAAGVNVATVYEEARKALLSTTLKSGDGDPLARLSVYGQARTIGNRPVGELELEFKEGVTVKPFQSLRPDSLAKVGYVERDLTSYTYFAPDADVLLSELFASSHCLGLTDGKGERAGWIGLTFRPQQFKRNFVDVSGTLWLDRASNELRRMDFTFEGLPIALQRVDAGGVVEFTRLPDGIWFVNRWELLMPRMTLPPAPPRVAGMFVRGGEVWWIKRGKDLLYTNGRTEPISAPKAVVQAAVDSTPVAAPCSPAQPGGATGLLLGTVLDERGAPLADVIVTVEWQQNHSSGGGRQLTWETKGLSTVSLRDGTFAICGVPSARLLTLSALYGTRKAPQVTVRMAEGETTARVDVRFGGVRADASAKGVVVRVRDGNGVPIAHALVEVEGGRGRVADDSGRVFIDAAPDSLRMKVRRIGHAPFVGRVGRARSGEFAVTLKSLAQALAAVTVIERSVKSPLELAGFYDRVQRAQRGTFNADFITPEELDGRQGARPTDLFQGRRFVSVVRTQGQYSQTYLQGRGRCNMTVYLDGRLLQPEPPRGRASSARSGGVVPIDELVNLNEVAAIEIYASAANAPAEMIPLVGSAQQGACGIVAIWTGGRR